MRAWVGLITAPLIKRASDTTDGSISLGLRSTIGVPFFSGAQLRDDRRGFGTTIDNHLRLHLVRSIFDSCRADAIEGQGD